jgi:hypothetical protein
VFLQAGFSVDEIEALTAAGVIVAPEVEGQ